MNRARPSPVAALTADHGGKMADKDIFKDRGRSFDTGIYVVRLAVSDGAVTVSDDVTIVVNPPAVIGTGTGLVGDYFNDPVNAASGSHFGTLIRGRLDQTVNFDWVSAAPVAGVSVDNFSVRWTGQVQAPVSGNYNFSTSADDGVRLWVNGQLLIDNWVDQAVTTKTSAAVALVGGRATTSEWNITSTAAWRRRGCCGRIRDRRRW